MAVTIDDFASLSGWNNGGGVSISPTGWAYHPGNASATGYIYKAMGTDIFCECKFYLDGSSSDWMMMKMNTGTSNMYNNTGSDGCGVAYRGTGGGFAYLGGTIAGWAGTWTAFRQPNSAANAITLGILRNSSTSYSFYCQSVLLGTQTTTQATTGVNFCIGGYNGIGAHFDYFLSADRYVSLYEARNVSSPLVI